MPLDALDQANLTARDLSAVAVTIGPGLCLCLRVGVQKARKLAGSNNLPIIGIHHMEAHALVSRLIEKELHFPFMALLISDFCRLVERDTCDEETGWYDRQLLCKSHPMEFASYFHYCHSLTFDQRPDNGFLKRLFRDLFDREGYTFDDIFDWTILKYQQTQKTDTGSIIVIASG